MRVADEATRDAGAAADLPEHVWDLIEGRVAAFEGAWRAGRRPRVADHLLDPDPTEGRLLVELVHADLEFRLKAGEEAQTGEYLEAFPELAARPLAAAELAEAEYRHRRKRGAGLDPTERRSDAVSGSVESPTAGDEPPRELGDYRLIRELGRGSMGVVYEAEQLSLRRRVAVKVLPMAGLLDERALRRFRNEALAAASLEHPGVVAVYGVGCDRGIHYLAMRLVDGPPLSEVVRRARVEAGLEPGKAVPKDGAAETPAAAALSTERSGKGKGRYRTAARLALQAAEALEYAHSAGVVHRDVKPSNLLVDASGRLWVADFGLAQVEADAGLTQSGDVLGTLRYMSPEQASGRRGAADGRSDVYALGLTLYELLTLKPAFPQTDRAALLRAVAEEDPPSPRAVDPRVPLDLETVVLKATAKDPGRRYQTAGALAEDLRRYLAGEAVLARRPSVLERGVKWARRHRAAAAALGVAAAALAVGAGAAAAEQARRAAAVVQEAREDLAAAGAAFAAGGLDLAAKELAEAARPGLPAELRAQADALRGALETFRAFKDHADAARNGWDYRVADQAPKALAAYGVLARNDWLAAVRAGPLPEPRRREVERLAYELLLLLADQEVRWRQNPADRRRALRYLAEAEPLGPTRALHHLRARAHEQLGDPGAAAASRRLADATPATIALDEFLPGRDAIDAGKEHWGESARLLRRALRLEQDHFPSLFFLGWMEDRGGADGAALLAWLGCLAARPDEPWSRMKLAGTLRRLGAAGEAEAERRRVAEALAAGLRARPADRLLLDVLRAACQFTGDHRPLRDAYEAAVAARPRDAELLSTAAEFYLRTPDVRLRDRARAGGLARTALEAAADTERLLTIASIAAAAGDLATHKDAASRLLERSVASDLTRDVYLAVRACTIVPGGPGDPKELVAAAERAGAAAPRQVDHHALGMARLRGGRTAEAAAAFRQGIAATAPGGGGVCDRLGLALAEHARGRVEEARRLAAEAGREVDAERDWFTWLWEHDRLAALVLQAEAGRLLGPPR